MNAYLGSNLITGILLVTVSFSNHTTSHPGDCERKKKKGKKKPFHVGTNYVQLGHAAPYYPSN